MKELIEVTAKYLPDGQLQPMQFIWKQQLYQIESTGRRWQEEEGLHLLVMIPGGQVFELLYETQEKCWYLLKSPPLPGSRA